MLEGLLQSSPMFKNFCAYQSAYFYIINASRTLLTWFRVHHMKCLNLHDDEFSERSEFHSFDLITAAGLDRYKSIFSYFTIIYNLLLGQAYSEISKNQIMSTLTALNSLLAPASAIWPALLRSGHDFVGVGNFMTLSSCNCHCSYGNKGGETLPSCEKKRRRKKEQHPPCSWK